MANPLGDFAVSAVVYGMFTTTAATTGAPTTLAGTPAISVYKDNSDAQSTTGVTLSVDADSVTGLNRFTVDTSADGTFYSSGSFFNIVITTGTVGGTSAVGYTVGAFTLQKAAGYVAMTANRTEPGQGAPAASTSMLAKIDYIYKNWRNRKTQTATTWSLYADDATTVDQKATVADDATTASKTEIATGP